jgi:hypothetical protein
VKKVRLELVKGMWLNTGKSLRNSEHHEPQIYLNLA